MNFRFEEQTHSYYLRDKKLISVTELLSKHGFTTDYSQVAPSVLEKARVFGDNRHYELEQYQKGLLSFDELSEVTQNGIKLLEEKGIETFLVEEKVHNSWLAGTIDLVGLQKKLDYVLVDYKFTSALNSYSVAWQSNIYSRLLYEQHQIRIDKLYVLWYDKQNDQFELRELPRIADEVIQELFDYESKGLLYNEEKANKLTVVANQLKIKSILISINEAETMVAKLNNELEIVKAEIMKEMVKHEIKSFDIDEYKITYVEPRYNKKVDYKKMVNDYKIDTKPYTTKNQVKGYLKITVGGETKEKAYKKGKKLVQKFAKEIGGTNE